MLTSAAMVLVLAGCGGGSGGSESPISLPSPVPSPVPSPTPSPAPAPTPSSSPTAVNDSLVQFPAVFSTNSAAYQKRTFQASPTLARVGARLWTAWVGDFSPAGWEATGNYLVLSYSDDDGNTWSREYYLVPKNPQTDRASDPRLWLAPDQKLWVIYDQSGGGMVYDGQLGVWAAVISDPLASAPSFAPGVHLTDGQPHRPFKYMDKWYLPSDYLGGSSIRFRERKGNHIYLLDWQRLAASKVGTLPGISDADFNEPAYVALKDGSLLAQSRTYQGIYQNQTKPGTFSFGMPVPWTFYPSTSSRNALMRSPSGRLVMVWNELNNGTRTDMTIAFSDDDGKSWPYSYTFDRRGDISYPDVDFAENGDVMIVYDRGRSGAKEILYARIDEASIVAGSPKVTIKLVNKAVKP